MLRELQCKIGRPHDDVVFLSILRQWLLQIPGEESSREREGIAMHGGGMLRVLEELQGYPCGWGRLRAGACGEKESQTGKEDVQRLALRGRDRTFPLFIRTFGHSL